MHNAPLSPLKAPFRYLAKGLVKEPGQQLFRSRSSGYKALPPDQNIEEEAHDAISKCRYHPVRIGDIIASKYRIVGKLGYGIGSTVWLANEFR